MAAPRRREEDLHWRAKLNQWTGLITSVGVFVGLILTVFLALGGQYTLPNDRAAAVEARVENNTRRIEAIEAKLDTTNKLVLDSVTRMIGSLQIKLDLLTVSKCREDGVWPPRLEATCDSLRNVIPLR